MEILISEDQLQEQIRVREILIVEFGSRDCLPCSAIRRKLEYWLNGKPEAGGIYIPTDRFPELCAQAGIYTVPAVMVYIRGQLTLRESGYFSLEEMLQRLDVYRMILKSTD